MDDEFEHEYSEETMARVEAVKSAVSAMLSEAYGPDGLLITDWMLIATGVDAADGDSEYHVVKSENIAYHTEIGLSEILKRVTEL